MEKSTVCNQLFPIEQPTAPVSQRMFQCERTHQLVIQIETLNALHGLVRGLKPLFRRIHVEYDDMNMSA
jgi:hypothetical protein